MNLKLSCGQKTVTFMVSIGMVLYPYTFFKGHGKNIQFDQNTKK